jgi:glycosyltransferase involved in cell wall biosynthesis
VLFAAALRLAIRARLVLTMHELWIPLSPHPARLLLGLLQRAQALALAALSDAAIVTTVVNRQRLTALPRPMRPPLQQLPVGSNVPVSTQPSARAEPILQGVPPSSAILAVFSPLTVGKAFLPLLDVLDMLPETSLLCIGGLSDGERVRAGPIRREIAQRGFAQRVVWTGYLPAEDVSGLLQLSALYLHLQEAGASFRSTALAAAMEHGLPIVAYRGRETEPDFVDGSNIRLVDPDEPRALTSTVRQVLADQALRQRLAAGAHMLWQQRCSWTSIAEATMACYGQIETPAAGRAL